MFFSSLYDFYCCTFSEFSGCKGSYFFSNNNHFCPFFAEKIADKHRNGAFLDKKMYFCTDFYTKNRR